MGLEINLGKTYTKDQTGKLVAGEDKKLDADNFKAGVKKNTFNNPSVFEKLDANNNGILDQNEIDELKGDIEAALDKNGKFTKKGMKKLQEKYGFKYFQQFIQFLNDLGANSAKYNITENKNDYEYCYGDEQESVTILRDKETGQITYSMVKDGKGEVHMDYENGNKKPSHITHYDSNGNMISDYDCDEQGKPQMGL